MSLDRFLSKPTGKMPSKQLSKKKDTYIHIMMDEKLEKMLHDITTNISQSLKEVTDRVSEAEQRILVVENGSVDADRCLLALEKTAKNS